MGIGQCRIWIGVALAMGVLAVPVSAAEKVARPDPSKRFDSIDEGQAALRNEVKDLREQVRELGDRLATLAEEERKAHEGRAAIDDANKQAHDESREAVRGLYVESSGIKGDVAQARQDVQAGNDSVERFRLSSGILIAVVIVLEIILIGLGLRGRG